MLLQAPPLTQKSEEGVLMQGTTITSKATKQQLEGGGKDIPEKNK